MDPNNIIAVTMGDPSGIGPQVILKAYPLLSSSLQRKIVVIGDDRVLACEAQRLKLKVNIKITDEINTELSQEGLSVIPAGSLSIGQVVKGESSSAGAKASLEFIDKAIELASIRKVGAMVTAPVNKNSISFLFRGFTGHTEHIAQRTASPNPVMMMVSPHMKVIPLTTHIPLSEVPNKISTQGIVNTILIAYKGMINYFGIDSPRIAVTGLNPHSGQDRFGNEEEEIIIPAIKRARESGIDVSGPHPADSVFAKAEGGFYDLTIAMYHDQALIPIKTLGFMKVVNVTLGIPFIRTSVGHGVAYDIAKGRHADPTSMINAIETAHEMTMNLFGTGQKERYDDQIRN